MKKLLLSQDMEAVSCHFREEQALLSALPLVSLEKKLFERSSAICSQPAPRAVILYLL
ncbi:MAG: hypothetical protein ACLTW9_27135 [Enterocloster sp.]